MTGVGIGVGLGEGDGEASSLGEGLVVPLEALGPVATWLPLGEAVGFVEVTAELKR
jgi:hypothetical protein